MDQVYLRGLLQEAAKPETSEDRLSQISRSLLQSAQEAAKNRADVLCIVHALFYETVKSHREYLPKLFPAFAVMCGGHPGYHVAPIDWSLAEPL